MSSILPSTKPAISLARSAAPTGRVLPDLSAMQVMMEQQAAMIEALKAELASKAKGKTISFKITSPKEDGTGSNGALSVYGVGRFPLTLYKTQWLKLIAAIPELQSFIKANDHLLTTKD